MVSSHRRVGLQPTALSPSDRCTNCLESSLNGIPHVAIATKNKIMRARSIAIRLGRHIRQHAETRSGVNPFTQSTLLKNGGPGHKKSPDRNNQPELFCDWKASNVEPSSEMYCQAMTSRLDLRAANNLIARTWVLHSWLSQAYESLGVWRHIH
jgi:hypothetical protein